VSFGLLSTAAINDALLEGARQSELVDVVAVASRDRARAEAYARERGIERAHGSYEALLEDPGVEAVYISLPNALHVPWSIRALEAGKHVLCEKPLSRRAARAEEAFDAADRAERLLVEGFMYRHHPQTRRLRELVERGTVGRPRVVRSTFSFSMADPAIDPRNAAELDGGALMDVGCYCLHATRNLVGEPERVYGHALVGPGGVDLRFAGLMVFSGDVMAQFDCGILHLPARHELELVGEEGSLFVADPWLARAPVIEHRHDGDVDLVEVEAANSYRLELDDLSRAIRGEAAPLLGRDDGSNQARALEALYASAESGRAVDLRSQAPDLRPSGRSRASAAVPRS
jgi:predicted dehydrogenase